MVSEHFRVRISLLILFMLAVFLIGCSQKNYFPDGHEATQSHIENHEQNKVHLHSGFQIYIDDKLIDLSVPKYQLRHNFIHVEDGIGDVVHVHERAIDMGFFMQTLGIKFDRNCIKIPDEGNFCTDEDQEISFYVNGEPNSEFERYVMKDKDRVLISYGKGNIDSQIEELDKVTII